MPLSDVQMLNMGDLISTNGQMVPGSHTRCLGYAFSNVEGTAHLQRIKVNTLKDSEGVINGFQIDAMPSGIQLKLVGSEDDSDRRDFIGSSTAIDDQRKYAFDLTMSQEYEADETLPEIARFTYILLYREGSDRYPGPTIRRIKTDWHSYPTIEEGDAFVVVSHSVWEAISADNNTLSERFKEAFLKTRLYTRESSLSAKLCDFVKCTKQALPERETQLFTFFALEAPSRERELCRVSLESHLRNASDEYIRQMRDRVAEPRRGNYLAELKEECYFLETTPNYDEGSISITGTKLVYPKTILTDPISDLAQREQDIDKSHWNRYWKRYAAASLLIPPLGFGLGALTGGSAAAYVIFGGGSTLGSWGTTGFMFGREQCQEREHLRRMLFPESWTPTSEYRDDRNGRHTDRKASTVPYDNIEMGLNRMEEGSSSTGVMSKGLLMREFEVVWAEDDFGASSDRGEMETKSSIEESGVESPPNGSMFSSLWGKTGGENLQFFSF